MKDLSEAITIIESKITRDMGVKTLKINQKRYISNLLKAEGMTLYHTTILFIEAGLFIYRNPDKLSWRLQLR